MRKKWRKMMEIVENWKENEMKSGKIEGKFQ